MSKKIEIGDLVKVDGVEHYVKYPMDNGVFMNEVNDLVIFTDKSEILDKNGEWTDFGDFTADEKKILVRFSGGAMKKEMEGIMDDEMMAEFTFKDLLKRKYIMRLFPNKEKYISKIEDRKVLKLL